MRLDSLQRAPWLGLSLLVHVVAMVLSILLAPQPTVAATGNHVTVDYEEEPDIFPLEPSEPEPRDPPELPADDILVWQPAKKEPWIRIPAEPPIEGPERWPTVYVPEPPRRRRIVCRLRRWTRPAVIQRGLLWLAKHQDKDGRWDADGFMKHDARWPRCDGPGKAIHDVGVTALALLAFLGDGSTMRAGPHRDNVKRAVRWLRSQQQPDGLFGTNASNDSIYNHCVAALAMCEAYGLSRYTVLKKSAQLGINYLEAHRSPNGAWTYQPRDNDNDTSVTIWAFMVYKSAKDFRLQVNDRALHLTKQHLDTKRGENTSEALTAGNLMIRFLMGQHPKKDKVMVLEADTILKKPPVWKRDGRMDHYYWYFATYALYQIGGVRWNEWTKHLHEAVVKTQRRDGNFRGSWDPAGVWGEDGGRVYSTAMLTITLEAHYRYSRLVR